MKLIGGLFLFMCSLFQVLQGAVLDPLRDVPLDENLLGEQARYILYVRPRGALGKELANYWKKVLNSDLSHEAIRKYPPHCSLTGFFPGKFSKEEYIQFLEQALEMMEGSPRTIH